MDDKNVDSNSSDQTFQETIQIVNDYIDELLGDPLLCDLPQGVTLHELKSHIALEHGQAMTIKVQRADGDVYPVIVDQNGTVSDLKKAIQRYVHLWQERCGCVRTISWKYVWRAFWLVFNGQKLKDNRKPLKEYGIQNRDQVIFLKRLADKWYQN